MQRLVKNTGVVFGALTENEAQLRNLITGSKRTFDATASKNDALAETIRIFPTFLQESKLTLARVQKFSTDTDPLITDLRPVARDLQPTLRDVRALAPDLERFFENLDPVITASKTGMPATREVLDGAEPLLGELGPVPRADQPDLQVLRGVAVAGRRLPQLRRRRAVGQDRVARRRHRPLPAPVRPARRRERLDLEGARADQPRQLLLPAAQHRRVQAGRRPGLRQVQDHGPVRLHELGREARADRRLARLRGPEPEPVRAGLLVLVQREAAPGRLPARRGRRLLVGRRRERRQQVRARRLGRGRGAARAGAARSRRARRRRAAGGR